MESPEKRLWLEVIYSAMVDASGHPNGSEGERRLLDIKQARAWLLGNSKDFNEVCALAGLEPDAVRERSQKLAENNWELPKFHRYYGQALAA